MALRPGCVLHLYFNDIDNPKFKFGILVCVDPPRFFLINTNIGDFVLNTAEARRSQVGIDVASHAAFLSHDSWIDCSQWYDGGFTSRALEQHVARNGRCVSGTIADETRERIIDVVGASRLLSDEEKESILGALA